MVRVPSLLLVGLGNYTHPNTRHRCVYLPLGIEGWHSDGCDFVSVGHMLIDSFAARLGVKLRDDTSLKSWVAQKEVDIIPPHPKGRPPKKNAPPLPAKRINIILLKPSAYPACRYFE